MKITYDVRSIMPGDLVTIESTAAVSEAVALMGKRDLGAVIVTRDREPVGILTERDVMRKCCHMDACRQMRVEDIMSKSLITVETNTPIGQAAQLMASKNIRRLLVKEKGAIVGIVTIRDAIFHYR